jgi:chemotaxis protein CheX
MDPKHIEPFLNAAVTTFDVMLGCQLIPLETFVKAGSQPPEYEVSGIIGLSSKKARGTVVLSLSREAALAATEAMLGERPSEINHYVVDAVGELTNIIAGCGKSKLEHLALNVSLPTTIVGKQHVMGFPQDATPVCIPYQCPWGAIAVEVALVEGGESAAKDGRGSQADRVPPSAIPPCCGNGPTIERHGVHP